MIQTQQKQQDTLAATSTSIVRTPTTDTRDTDQREHGNDEPDNPGEWTTCETTPNEVKTTGSIEKIETDSNVPRTRGEGRAAENGNG